MLRKVTNSINASTHSINNGTLFCNGFNADNDVIDFLNNYDVFENVHTIIPNTNSDAELSLYRLSLIGYYVDLETLILRNKYSHPDDLFYIKELNSYSDEPNPFLENYSVVLSLIGSLKLIAKHSYYNTDELNVIIYSEDNSVVIPIVYNNLDIIKINRDNLDKLRKVIAVFEEDDSEKKILFKNELIAYLNGTDNEYMFGLLLSSYVGYYEASINSYHFYLRNFSYNKLKIELDSKALEYTQKIQSVINDSQGKLVAIPTALVLVFLAFDFNEILSIKNLATVISTFIFSGLIQLFLANQKTALRFIEDNIQSYRDTFANNHIKEISARFTSVYTELDIQKRRIVKIEFLLWSIPVLLISVAIGMYLFKDFDLVAKLSFIHFLLTK